MKTIVKKLAMTMTMIFIMTAIFIPTSAAAPSNLGKPAINIDNAATTILIDGEDTDAAWAATTNYANIMDTYKVIGGVWATAQPTDCGNVSILKILWTADYIYTFIKVNDATLSTPMPAAHLNDSVEYFIDASNCDKLSYNGIDDAQYRLGRDGAISGWGGFNATAFKSNSVVKTTETGYTQEARISVSDHGLTKLVGGETIGFDFQVNDARIDPISLEANRIWQIVWNSLDTGWYEPASLGTIILNTPAPTVAPTASPTPPVVGAVSIKLNKTSASLAITKTLQLSATVSIPYLASHAVTWKSSNSAIASVSYKGKVTAKAVGTATITATSVTGGKKATCKITVYRPVSSIKLNKTLLSMRNNKSFKLNITITPSNATNKKVVWKSSNKAVATVSSTGLVKSLKDGTAYITVTSADGSKVAKCKVVVL
ncbi:MAG: Ig-like domain-containing protein [Bacillota bacterium]